VREALIVKIMSIYFFPAASVFLFVLLRSRNKDASEDSRARGREGIAEVQVQQNRTSRVV
jgi:hypothetical protein